MGQIEDLRTFIQIVEHGSIGKAAEQAGVAKSAMSRKLRLLEERMQAVLIARTTRQWALTEVGREYYERGQSILSSFDEFESRVRNEGIEVRGEIKLSVPLYFGKISLSSCLMEFSKLNPAVHLNIDFTDRFVDVIDEHFDLVVRISELPDSTLIARKLCETEHLYCASPEYLKNSPPINSPQDLRAHRINQYGSAKRPKWFFKPPNGKQVSVALTASMNSHDGGFLIDAAEQGLGIVRVPDFMVKSSLDSGKLVQVLPDYRHSPHGVYIVYPTTRYLPYRVRALVDYLIDKVSEAQ